MPIESQIEFQTGQRMVDPTDSNVEMKKKIFSKANNSKNFLQTKSQHSANQNSKLIEVQSNSQLTQHFILK